MEISITSVEDGYLIYSLGDGFLNKRIVFHLVRSFNAKETKDGIFVPNTDENIISKLSDYLSRKDINLKLDSKSNNDLKKLFDEEQEFKVFSMKAKEIWSREMDSDTFEEFCNVLDKKLTRSLYPLQLLSAFHLAFSQNACNFSVPGSGKTSIVYGAYTYLNQLSKNDVKFVDKILVIGPLSSFGPWENEYKECFGKSTTVKRLSGGNFTSDYRKKYLFSRSTAEITLISYQGILSQKKNIEHFLKNNNVMIILDEAHKIKNTDGGAIAETVLYLAPFAKSRVILTGTPSPNGYRDLHNLFKFIWPNKSIIDYSLNQLDDMTSNVNDPRIDELINDISPFFIRIKKKDLGLPEKTEYPPISVPMDETQDYIYSVLEKKVFTTLIEEEEEGIGIISSFKKAKIIRLMQAASNPYLLLKPIEAESITINTEYETDEDLKTILLDYSNKNRIPPKFDAALNLIKEIISRGEKVIVWAIYIDTLERFSDFLMSEGISSKILYGKTKVESEGLDDDIETREKIIQDFHKCDSNFNVIIANPFAVAESISLHKACHNAIYLERNFDGARFVQSKDRIHRYGLEMDTITNYYYLNTSNSVDEVIHERLKEKENLMIRVTENSDIPLFNILEEDIDESDIRRLINNYVKKSNEK